jgi:hypothetical protein
VAEKSPVSAIQCLLDIHLSDDLREVLEALPTMKLAEAAHWTPAQWKTSRETQNA